MVNSMRSSGQILAEALSTYNHITTLYFSYVVSTNILIEGYKLIFTLDCE